MYAADERNCRGAVRDSAGSTKWRLATASQVTHAQHSIAAEELNRVRVTDPLAAAKKRTKLPASDYHVGRMSCV